VMVNLAIAYMNAGALQQASSVLKRASRLQSNLSDLIEFNRGELLERRGETEAAIRQYEKVAGSIYVDHDLLNRKLGLLHLQAKRYDDALASFRSTLAAQTDLTLPYKEMLWRGLDTYEGDTINLPLIEAQLAQGITLDDLAVYDLRIIREVQSSDREIAKTHNHLGYIQVQRKDYVAAADHYRRSLAIWPGNSDAQRALAYLASLPPEGATDASESE